MGIPLIALLITGCTIKPTLVLSKSSRVVTTLAFSSPTASQYINLSNVSSFSVTGNCSENGATVTVQSGAQSIAAVCGSNVFHATLDFTATPDGSVTITADQVSSDGVSASQASVTLTKDATAPTAPSSVTANPTSGFLTSSVDLSWTSGTDVGGTGVADDQVAIGTTSGSTDVLGYTNAGNVTSKTLAGLSLTYGETYFVSLKTLDIAGNESSATTVSWRAIPYQGAWTATTTTGAPAGARPRVFWTGSKALFWGTGTAHNQGTTYDPVANTWSPITTTGAYISSNSAVWTGSKMITWGAWISSTSYNTGSSYDPVTNTWSAITTTGAPTPRSANAAVWTGSKMIVWGGFDNGGFGSYPNTGGLYDVASNSWATMTTTGAPSGRKWPGALWTGSKVLIWAGDSPFILNDGARYDPATDSWSPITTTGAPLDRENFVFQWTGSKALLWGGSSWVGDPAYNDGALYDPAADNWTAVTTAGAPSPRYVASSVWTGSRLVVWGGFSSSSLAQVYNDGGIYDPATDQWVATTTLNSPTSRYGAPSVWTGSKMIVWGGANNTGGIFDPQFATVDSWSPMTTTGAPNLRDFDAATWTGSKMLVIGDQSDMSSVSGGLYDPVANSWTPTTTTNALIGTDSVQGVWTGSKMIIWGGLMGLTHNAGNIYDVAADTWTRTTTTGAPEGRYGPAQVWTGGRMIVWGGEAIPGGLVPPYTVNSGSTYDPVANSWTAMTTTGAPADRYFAASAWTGSRFLVWGGVGASTGSLNDGGLYDPMTDSWTAVTSTGAPASNAVGVWTGSKLLTRNGGVYDPTSDTWSSMTTTGAPSSRDSTPLVWTGSRMICWGGSLTADGSYLNDGFLYDPANDRWTAMTSAGAPGVRAYHSAVWTGSKLIIFGGANGPGSYLNDGAIYTPGGSDGTPPPVGDGTGLVQ